MSALSIQPTFPIFTGTDGLPLENGYIWIGEANLDPQGNPITVYWDAALTIAAAQPIRTLAGYPSRSGTPARVYVNSDYSIRVQDKNASTVYSAPQATERVSSNLVTYQPPFTGGVPTTVQNKLAQTVSPEDFGAVGDGVTDDTTAIQAALNALPEGQWLDGLGLTYLITDHMTSSSDDVRLRNFNFVFGTTYGTDGTFAFTGNVVHLENINVDGGRGTYKVGLEPWRSGSTFEGYIRIFPAYPNTANTDFFIDHTPGVSQSAKFFASNCTFENMFVFCIMYSRMYGESFVQNCVFKNYAMQDIAMWHTKDGGVTNIGHSFLSKIYCQDQAILPNTFTVDGVTKNFATSGCAAMDAYGLLIAHGDAHYSDITFVNYNTCAVTAETCNSVKMSNVHVVARSDRQYSNNPSGAVWLENCRYSDINNVSIDIQARDPRDYAGPAGNSSAIFLLSPPAEAAVFNVSNLQIKLHPSITYISKAFRVVCRGPEFAYNFANIDVSGSVDNTLSVAMQNGEVIKGDLNVSNFVTSQSSGSVIVYGINNVNFSNSQFGTSVQLRAASDFSITGSASNLAMTNCVVTEDLRVNENYVNSTVLNNVQMGLTKVLAFPTSGTGSCYFTDSTLANTTINTTKNVSVKGCVIAGMTISTANNANITGNKSTASIQIKDVQTFEIVGNDARISTATSAILINPVTAANILAGVISSNNVLIKTGTAGAGYVTIAGGVTGVTDVNNNKLTVAWT